MSAKFLTLVLLKFVAQLQPYYDGEIHRRGGHFICGDHSFKFIKHLGKFDGTPIAAAVYTDCNEYSEITLQQITQTTTMEELRESFKQDVNTRKMLGTPQVKIRSSDLCCQDASVLESVYELNRGLTKLVPLPTPEPLALSIKNHEDSASLMAHFQPFYEGYRSILFSHQYSAFSIFSLFRSRGFLVWK